MIHSGYASKASPVEDETRQLDIRIPKTFEDLAERCGWLLPLGRL